MHLWIYTFLLYLTTFVYTYLVNNKINMVFLKDNGTVSVRVPSILKLALYKIYDNHRKKVKPATPVYF